MIKQSAKLKDIRLLRKESKELFEDVLKNGSKEEVGSIYAALLVCKVYRGRVAELNLSVVIKPKRKKVK